MTISDWINEISVKFDELGFVPTTLTDEKNEHFVEWFVTEIEQIKESEKLLIEAAKKGVSQRYIELLRENASIRTLLEKFETENTELRARLEKKDIFTSGDTDSLSGIQKIFISVVKTGILPQEPMNYDGAAMKTYISYLEFENSELRARLEKAVELPRIIHPNKNEWFIQYQIKSGIIDYSIRYSKEAAEARLAELKGEKK